MTDPLPTLDVYLEIGTKRTFAGVIAWPGWCRSGRDEDAALQALAAAGPRYVKILNMAEVQTPAGLEAAAFVLVERLPGTATTDFGAPDLTPASDANLVDAAELARLQSILRGAWAALDRAFQAAEGLPLRTGSRGGGRDRDAILRHVLESEQSYLSRLGGRLPKKEGENLSDALARTRQTILDTLAASARGEIPAQGPRGGARWTPRAFVRRAAWHILDHAWEIEDRAGM